MVAFSVRVPSLQDGVTVQSRPVVDLDPAGVQAGDADQQVLGRTGSGTPRRRSRVPLIVGVVVYERPSPPGSVS